MEDANLHEVVITAIIRKGGRYLIIRRSKNKKRFPGKWVVPGGHVEVHDHLNLPKDSKQYSRNVLEHALKREVKEEVGISISKICYVTNLATIHTDGRSSIVISCCAEYAFGSVALQEEEVDKYMWVTLAEAKDMPLMDGIYEELIMVDKLLKE